MINEEAMVAALEARNQEAQILGVLDITSNANAPVGPCTLGEAFRFIANAPIVRYDARAARVMYGETGTPSLRAGDCAILWAKFGMALLQRRPWTAN
jgi:hypothetical protein